MKWFWKTLLAVLVLYLLFWGGLAIYFSFSDKYKNTVEVHLSQLFQRPVTIDSLQTQWQGFSPQLRIQGLNIAGDEAKQPAFAFEDLSATFDPVSILLLWPTFTEFNIEKPILQVTSYEDGTLEIASIKLQGQKANPQFSKKLMSWLLDQHSASWKGGEIVWRKQEIGEQTFTLQRYQNIDMTFSRVDQNRRLAAEVLTPKGFLAFIANANGDLLSANDWDASMEVLGNNRQSLLKPEELSVSVVDGQGLVKLTTLDLEHIRDFIRLSGLAADARWLLEAKLEGRLYDVSFNFSGPLLNIDDWDLNASASDVGFKSIGRAPAMNKLSGRLSASKTGGEFEFATRDSEFSWSQWYAQPFPVKQASGEFYWVIEQNGDVQLDIKNAEFEDPNIRISDLFLNTKVSYGGKKVSSFADLFTVNSVKNLSFEDGVIVSKDSTQNNQSPIVIEARANFEMYDIGKVSSYIPNIQSLGQFQNWAKHGFAAGQISNGTVSYQGILSKDAFTRNLATLEAKADFTEVTIDYAPEQNWPAAKQGQGSATLSNELLTITPSSMTLNGDKVTSGVLTIANLFQSTRELSLRGKTKTSLIKGVDFLFKGPLFKPEDRMDELPFLPTGGAIDLDIEVDIPLSNIETTKVRGLAQFQDGTGELIGGVPITNIEGTVRFTERKVSSNNINAEFLGGDIDGRLITLQEAQPPVLKLIASGVAKTNLLEPWVGEHVLSWFDGEAPWNGSVTIDNDRVDILAKSDLIGVEVSAPKPLKKLASEPSQFEMAMTVGGPNVPQRLAISYKERMNARFNAELGPEGSFFDRSLISIGTDSAAPLKEGVNFLIEEDQVDLDDWISAVIDMAALETTTNSEQVDTSFMDAMRSINISVKDPVLLGYKTGPLNITAVSVDGFYWIGTLDGENVDGTMQLQPRDDVGKYSFSLNYLNLDSVANEDAPLDPVDFSLLPNSFPSLALDVKNFRFEGKNLGHLTVSGEPIEDQWRVDSLILKHNGVNTQASGVWSNDGEFSSQTSIEFNVEIDEAEGVLNDMDFDGIVRKGKGNINGVLEWAGAPHEFDYSRLNGRFDAFIRDGELVQVEPGSGKLLGLLNFNAMARRLIFDFRDVFASGLQFDRMRYAGLLADGELIFTDAFIFSPAVFVRMEGKLDLAKELVDMEIHISPELGGNITLLSALANPAAGAVVFLTQQIFKDEMRNSSFMSYRALGTWKDFEMLEMKNGVVVESPSTNVDQSASDKVIEDPLEAEKKTGLFDPLKIEDMDVAEPSDEPLRSDSE